MTGGAPANPVVIRTLRGNDLVTLPALVRAPSDPKRGLVRYPSGDRRHSFKEACPMFVSLLVLLLFLAAVGAAAATGAVFRPGDWYRTIKKPGFTPPDWVFAPAWTLLYLMIAVSGFVVWTKVGFAAAPWAFALYFLQIGLNGLWSPIFFGAKRPDLATLDIAALWVAIVATIIAFSKLSLTAAFLLVPYLLWVTFAAALTVSIWRLNRRPADAAAGG